ncbi:MAG: DUF3631 domain-containing protein, partial [Xanthobacteraceae bacterium]
YPAEEAQYAHQLHGLPESPWGNIRGRPLDDRGLAQRLRRYEIRPKVLKSVNQRGYRREDFEDAWLRYLAPLSCQGA